MNGNPELIASHLPARVDAELVERVVARRKPAAVFQKLLRGVDVGLVRAEVTQRRAMAVKKTEIVWPKTPVEIKCPRYLECCCCPWCC